jgi:hypothetical protein|tara:strand:- start:333 stop:596 length:264 start_codon:yes stop_codon:yes gene_type:complete
VDGPVERIGLDFVYQITGGENTSGFHRTFKNLNLNSLVVERTRSHLLCWAVVSDFVAIWSSVVFILVVRLLIWSAAGYLVRILLNFD